MWTIYECEPTSLNCASETIWHKHRYACNPTQNCTFSLISWSISFMYNVRAVSPSCTGWWHVLLSVYCVYFCLCTLCGWIELMKAVQFIKSTVFVIMNAHRRIIMIILFNVYFLNRKLVHYLKLPFAVISWLWHIIIKNVTKWNVRLAKRRHRDDVYARAFLAFENLLHIYPSQKGV